MKKMKLACALLVSTGLLVGSAVPALADSSKVVTLGADLNEQQRQTMLRYFKVDPNEVEIIYITNQDERNHLSSYVPIEQIGNRTVSCAYVKPTQSGGIKVRTANLNWVTCNMIASTLSTSGVKNCEVVAACPFEVSGTGALTGVQMAYEQASGVKLDEEKKELATQEMVVTANLGTELGKKPATTIINESKMEVIGNEVTSETEIQNIVNNVVQNNNVSLNDSQLSEIVDLLQQIADQGYSYDDVKDTLQNVEENLVGEELPIDDSGDIADDAAEEGAEVGFEADAEEVSILDAVDSSALEGAIEESTEDPTLEEMTGAVDIDPGMNVAGDDEMTAEETSLDVPTGKDLSMLDEQAKHYYETVQKFCEGVYLGDWEKLSEATGDELYDYGTVILDDETSRKLSDEVEKLYYDILVKGTSSYVASGTEKYMSTELNMLDQMLRDLFGIEYTGITGEDAKILESLSPEDKNTLYNELIHFIARMYGETTESPEDEMTDVDMTDVGIQPEDLQDEMPAESMNYETLADTEDTLAMSSYGDAYSAYEISEGEYYYEGTY